MDNVSVITIAPELPGMMEVIPTLVEKNITVSIGTDVRSHNIYCVHTGTCHYYTKVFICLLIVKRRVKILILDES